MSRRFCSLAEAVAAMHAAGEPMVLTRFAPEPRDTVVIAVNTAAAAEPTLPHPGDHPDLRRNPSLTADIELDYLYRQLAQRGHAQQVLSLDSGELRELAITRVDIDGDDRLYGFVSPRVRAAPKP
ncbi:MAG: hypothetical protein ACREFB_01025 [Stellaceae bacterium]